MNFQHLPDIIQQKADIKCDRLTKLACTPMLYCWIHNTAGLRSKIRPTNFLFSVTHTGGVQEYIVIFLLTVVLNRAGTSAALRRLLCFYITAPGLC